MGVEFVGSEAEVVVEESAEVGRAVGSVGNDFHAIAGGDDEGFLDAGVGDEIAAGLGQTRLGYGEALTDFERGAHVIHADEVISHFLSVVLMRRRTCGWQRNSWRPKLRVQRRRRRWRERRPDDRASRSSSG